MTEVAVLQIQSTTHFFLKKSWLNYYMAWYAVFEKRIQQCLFK